MKEPAKPPTFHEYPTVFKGIRFDVHAVEVEGLKGKKVKREVATHPGAVLILPIVDENNILLIRNERFAVGKTLWELPAGTLEPNEEPIETARRELIEETGYKAGEIKFLSYFFTTPGFTNELMINYIAKDLTHVGQHLDDNERITVEIVSFEKALSMVKEGVIIDGKTIAALLYYHQFIRAPSPRS